MTSTRDPSTLLPAKRSRTNKLDTPKPAKSKRKSAMSQVIDSVKNCQASFCYDSDSLLIIFDGAHTIGTNQMLAQAQIKPRPFNLMAYKKAWHEKMAAVLESIVREHLASNIPLPQLANLGDGEAVKITLYRQSKATYDQDNLFAGFKYIIDALHRPISVDGIDYQILRDDDQDNLGLIESYQSSIKEVPATSAYQGHCIIIKLDKYRRDRTIHSVEQFLEQ